MITVQTVESRRGCLAKFAQGTIPKDFPLFVRVWALQIEEDGAQSCPMGLSGETVGRTLTSLTVLNPDFGG